MISALVNGDLVSDPVTRSTRDGKPYTTATMRVPTGAQDLFIGIAAFELASQRFAAVVR